MKKSFFFIVLLSMLFAGFVGCSEDETDNQVKSGSVKKDNGESCEEHSECQSGLCRAEGKNKFEKVCVGASTDISG